MTNQQTQNPGANPFWYWLKSLFGISGGTNRSKLDLGLRLPDTFEFSPKKVRSSSEPGLVYDVDVRSMSCTCPSFINRRSKFESPDIRRLCKHLVKVLSSRGAFDDCNDIVMLFVGQPPKDHIKVHRLDSGRLIYLGFSKNDPWIDVYSQVKRRGEKGEQVTGGYSRFGFNRETKGWSYGAGPPGAREIREIVAYM